LDDADIVKILWKNKWITLILVTGRTKFRREIFRPGLAYVVNGQLGNASRICDIIRERCNGNDRQIMFARISGDIFV
jgi:hypothetical protein